MAGREAVSPGQHSAADWPGVDFFWRLIGLHPSLTHARIRSHSSGGADPKEFDSDKRPEMVVPSRLSTIRPKKIRV